MDTKKLFKKTEIGSNFDRLVAQKQICMVLNQAMLFNALNLTFPEIEFVNKCFKTDKHLQSWHLSALRKLAMRIDA